MKIKMKLCFVGCAFVLVIFLGVISLNFSTPKVIKETIQPQYSIGDIGRISHNYPSGTILFGSRVDEPSLHYEYYLMNADGAPLADIGTFTGFSAWSPDGKSLAIGCENIDQLCILDMTSVAVYRSFPVNIHKNLRATIIQKIDLPDQCTQIGMSDRGISSLSWSKNGKKLIVVCKNHFPDSLRAAVCFLSLSGQSDCWPEEKSAGVTKAVYSPTDDHLAISKKGNIEIVKEDGSVIKTLIPGVNPAWSPDGKQLAYFAYYENGPRNGIGVVNTDEENQSWLYIQPKNGSIEEFLCGLCSGNSEGGISWSPDGNFITFSAVYLGDYTIAIFRENVDTKEITILVGLHGFYNYPKDPNWGNLDFQ